MNRHLKKQVLACNFLVKQWKWTGGGRWAAESDRVGNQGSRGRLQSRNTQNIDKIRPQVKENQSHGNRERFLRTKLVLSTEFKLSKGPQLT